MVGYGNVLFVQLTIGETIALTELELELDEIEDEREVLEKS